MGQMPLIDWRMKMKMLLLSSREAVVEGAVKGRQAEVVDH